MALSFTGGTYVGVCVGPKGMQEIKTNALGIRVTDAELRRLEAIKAGMGLPSMTNTTLGHDLLVIGMEAMEKRSERLQNGKTAVKQEPERAPSSKKKLATRQARKREAVHV